ncbi:MAG TPA: relaxase, partial [Ruminiclostridium sp.]|nr:relaxase [Ruminiclostridium sp.]
NAAGRAATTADAQSLSPDTAGFGRAVRDFNNPAGADEGLTATESQPKNADKQSAGTGGADSNLQEPHADTADLITGWEQERVFLFSAQAEIATNRMDGLALDTNQLASLGSDIISLGRSVESLSQPVRVRDSTTRPAVKEHKKGVGQKQDDHSGYDFEMKM